MREAFELYCQFGFTALDSNGLTQGQNAVRRAEKLYSELPVCLKEYAGSYANFIATAKEADAAFLTYERNRFIKAMPEITKRVEYKQALECVWAPDNKRIAGGRN